MKYSKDQSELKVNFSIELEGKIPLLMHCDICKPRMKPVGQNIGVCFLAYRTCFNNF